MTAPERSSSALQAELIRRLQDLIVALDQRVPHVERAGEASIARDAAALKAKALQRIAELQAGSDAAAPETRKASR
jgi:hypothetical protein